MTGGCCSKGVINYSTQKYKNWAVFFIWQCLWICFNFPCFSVLMVIENRRKEGWQRESQNWKKEKLTCERGTTRRKWWRRVKVHRARGKHVVKADAARADAAKVELQRSRAATEVSGGEPRRRQRHCKGQVEVWTWTWVSSCVCVCEVEKSEH